MDEVTKTIIETSVTVLGMLAAFIAAFLAEPVKSYFQNKGKVKNLRVALYQEILYNYIALTAYLKGDISDETLAGYIARRGVRVECYRNALEHDVSLYYQLWEVHSINAIQNTAVSITELSSDITTLLNEEATSTNITRVFKSFTHSFVRSFTMLASSGNLDMKLLKKLLPKHRFQEIMEKGKEYAKEH